MTSRNIEILKNGGIGVVLTDTIFGILGSAMNKQTVERIYKLKGRDKNKPLIILISNYSDLKLFDIKINKNVFEILKTYWPGKVSVILPCSGKKFKYLHRDTNSLAFRLPKNRRLLNLIKKTGPLVAPSANPQGKTPASNIETAKEYFDNQVDFYERGRVVNGKPSTLIKIKNSKVKILRP